MRSNQKEQRNVPDLSDVLNNLKEEIYKNINAVQVGNVQAFDATTQTVSVQMAIKQVIDIDGNGVKRYQSLPLLIECPIIIFSGGDARITIPPQVGDGCLLLFNDRDIENWFLDGGDVTPNTFRKHDLSDAFAVVGVRNMQTVISGFLEDGVQLQWNSANKIEIKAGTIESTTPILKQIGTMTVTDKVTANDDVDIDKNLLVKGDAQVNGNALVKGGLTIGGTVKQEAGGSPLIFDADLEQTSGKVLKAGNGDTGTFTTVDGKTVTVDDGIISNIV